jgi:hypothetical protein
VKPRPGAAVTLEQTALVLAHASARIRANDSDDGYVRWWRPEVRIYSNEYETLPAEQKVWYDKGGEPDGSVVDSTSGVWLQEYVLRDDAPNVMLVEASYRVGNSMGQGGMRIIDASLNPFA